MTQKPSERILEIRRKILSGTPYPNNTTRQDLLDAIVEYLDEEYAKNQAIINSDKIGRIGMV